MLSRENACILNDIFTTLIGTAIATFGIISIVGIIKLDIPTEEKTIAINAIMFLAPISGVGVAFSNKVTK